MEKTKVGISRRNFIAAGAAALSVAGAGGLFAAPVSASAASATSTGVGYVPPEDEQLWFANTSFTTMFWQTLTINGVTANYELGFNTIPIIVRVGSGANEVYRLIPYMQYFPDVDDPSTAQWMLMIYSILVNGQEYLIGGYADIPTSYTQYNSLNEPYVVCTVRANIIYIGSSTPRPDPDVINVQWAPAYLKIPAGV